MFAEFIEVQKLLNTVPPRQSGEKNKNQKICRIFNKNHFKVNFAAWYFGILFEYTAKLLCF